MLQSSSIPTKWRDLIVESLNTGSSKDKIFALDFLSQQTSLNLEFSKELMPSITQAVVSPDPKVRDYARRARNHILDSFPEIEISKSVNIEPFKLELKEGEKLTAQQILLYKLRLRSRYVVFEAMDRLTESGDSSLVEPLIDYLNQEKDEHKIAYLIRLMGRFEDDRIPEVLEKYLDYEDSRIVANALEALCEFNVPHLSSTFADFAMSSNMQIRCNAVRGLFRYSPAIAEKHISEMVRSKSYAMQDIGVYLLRIIRPSNLGELLNVVNNSKYADIRLRALDIAPPSEEETVKAEMMLKENIEQPNEKRDLAFFAGFLILSACLFLITNPTNRYMLALLFVIVGILTVIRPDKTRTSIQKTAISMGFISSIIMGSTRLMLIPSLMGLWLTWIGSRFNHRGKLEKVDPEYIFAWFFAMTSILLTQ
ncbi:MAG: HEAT repeat domain-containing protein, partial [Candidatus Riflebacteria bacterium]|nr:HEAT repeat domain-containing protein [Candidatus Riflebacteria bacterium]